MASDGLRPQLASLRSAVWREGILLIPLAALIACLPRVTRGISCGHDFEFHLISWMETQRDWSQGVLYPHWAQSPNWGAGEPRFVFYPPLSWVLGALLGYVMRWTWVPVAFTWLCLTVSGLTTRRLARAFLPGSTATLAGVIATATPYALFTAYERTAFSELAAAALVPLLLLYALRPAEAEQARSARLSSLFPIPYSLRLCLTLAAIWLTNAPAGVMASYLLAFAALAAGWLQRSWLPVIRAVVAAPLALGLAAVYLVPAAWEQRWIAINQALDVGMRIRDSWLFARHAGPDMELHDQVLRMASSILLLTVVLAVCGFFIAWRKDKLPRTARSFWLPLALLIPILLLLQFPVSAPLWNLPKMQYLQFPWRWLIVLDAPCAIFLAAATPLGSRRAQIGSAIGWAAVVVLFITTAFFAFFQLCDQEDDVDNQISIFHDGSGVEGTDEYGPAGADNTLVASNLPDACLVSDARQELGETDSGSEPVWYPEQGSCDGTFSARLWQDEHKLLQIDSDHDGFIILRLRRYPAWKITVNGAQVPVAATREDGLVVVPVRAGPATIDVRWMTTPDAVWGERISGISLAMFALLAGLSIVRRRSGGRQSPQFHLSSEQCQSTSNPT